MPVDLKLSGLLKRGSLLVRDDHMIALEHASYDDRMERILFDRVDSVRIWHRVSWEHIALISILLLFPGFLLVTAGAGVAGLLTLGIVLLAIGAILLLFTIVAARRVTCLISRAGEDLRFVGYQSTRRIERFASKLRESIILTQTDLRAKRQAAQNA